MHFFLGFVWQFKKKQYLCTRKTERYRLFFEILQSKCGNSSVGRAQPCQGWGREFESRFPLTSLNLCLQPRSRCIAQVAEW